MIVSSDKEKKTAIGMTSKSIVVIFSPLPVIFKASESQGT